MRGIAVHFMARSSKSNACRLLRLPRHATPRPDPREGVPDPPFFSAALARTSASPRRASTPCSSPTSYGVTPARRTTRRLRACGVRFQRRPTIAQTYRRADARPWPRGPSHAIALPLALTLGQSFYVLLTFFCFRFSFPFNNRCSNPPHELPTAPLLLLYCFNPPPLLFCVGISPI